MRISRSLKWIGDRVFAALLLAILSPVLVGIGVAIALLMGRPVIFKQPRPGYKAKVFQFYKFRTMTDRRDAQGAILPDEQRMVPFGLWLRQTSLDELPQLWNVLKGDMSFIGPRPLLTRYLDRYTPEQARRHDVMPGITGWAQVKGRNAISWEEKFRFDIWYIDRWSLGLDLKIIGLTLLKVFKQEGISAPNHATMPEFLGNASDASTLHPKDSQ
jgi:lipopolysaccharide/colanic/teichoic acid biosynthesis glycosyltransferase